MVLYSVVNGFVCWGEEDELIVFRDKFCKGGGRVFGGKNKMYVFLKWSCRNIKLRRFWWECCRIIWNRFNELKKKKKK